MATSSMQVNIVAADHPVWGGAGEVRRHSRI